MGTKKSKFGIFSQEQEEKISKLNLQLL